MNKRSGNFAITDFSYDENLYKKFFEQTRPGVSYINVGALEYTEDNKKHHHVTIVMKGKVLIKTIREYFVGRHVEELKSVSAHIRYSTEEGPSILELGDKPAGQGARTDLKEWTDKLLNGEVSLEDIIINEPTLYHQYGRTFNAILEIRQKGFKRIEKPKVIWIYGETGVGKSKISREFGDWFSFNTTDKGWQDKYEFQNVFIIDDLRWGTFKYDELLRMLDRYSYSLPCRGKAPKELTSNIIFINSSKSPEDIYGTNDNDNINQLIRRIDLCINLTKETYMKAKNDISGLIIEDSIFPIENGIVRND